MQFKDVSVPSIYQSSADFRFFLRWFSEALTPLKYNIENMADLYDPLRCPANLLWMLADTMGFRYDDRLPVAYNRLVLLYFMAMIRNRGSINGMTLAAEVNLAQLSVLKYGEQNSILYDRLEDVSIPVNAVSVIPHTPEGYIDVIYFSTEEPVDVCIDYVRPVGMYVNVQPGVAVHADAKISIDARLTNISDARAAGLHDNITHVSHYTRYDFASIQKTDWPNAQSGVRYPGQEPTENRDSNNSYYRNSEYEQSPTQELGPGYRTLYSLQLCNNEHIVQSLLPNIFGLGYGPTAQEPVELPDDEYLPDVSDAPRVWNLRYDKVFDELVSRDVVTVDGGTPVAPEPAVNPVMAQLGDALQ